MDITATTAPKSDQQNFDDYAGGITRTVTVTEVRKGGAEQPVEIHLAEHPRHPYKPSKSMRRVLVAAWGPEASEYVGRRMRLYGDPSVKFGGAVVGGIKISHLSNIDKPLSVSLTVSKGKRAPHTVEPLTDDTPPAPTEPSADDVAACEDIATLRAWWKATAEGSERREQIEGRVAELQAQEGDQ